MNDTHQIQHAINAMNKKDAFSLNGNPALLCEFQELFAKIQSIQRCYKEFQKLLIFMPMQDGMCRRNTLLLRLLKMFDLQKKQHVWHGYLNPSITESCMILQLKAEFEEIFIETCYQYFANNYALSAKKFKQTLEAKKNEKRQQEMQMYKRKFNLQSKASYETVEVAKKQYRKNIIAWSMLIDDHNLAADAIIDTSAHAFDGDFETTIVNHATSMHGCVKLPSSENMKMGDKAGALTFEFA